MKSYIFICFSLLFFSSLCGTSITERTAYPAFCQSAALNEKIFRSFKRNAIYREVLEHVPYKSGLEYLNIIIKEYPDLLPYFDKFRENDRLGSPVTYSYGGYGVFSPTTLRYIKTAGDIRKKMGDVSQLHIVEIGGGYGGQCVIFSALGFASYTLIDLPEAIALSKKYLGRLGIQNVFFMDSTQVNDLNTYDLVISNYAFSAIDKSEQIDYFEKIIKNTPKGYLLLNFISHHFNLDSLSLDEIVSMLYHAGRSGKAEKEKPNTHADNMLVTWRATREYSVDIDPLHPTYDASTKINPIGYEFSGGRFGDNLISFFHAKWIAYKYQLPFLYSPFQFSDQLALHEKDPSLTSFHFDRTIVTSDEEQISQEPQNSTAIIIPHIPECAVDYASLPAGALPYIKVDWEDPNFRAELVKCLTPKASINTLSLPLGYITVGVHVRKGGGHDNYEFARRQWPLKFPPDDYYIKQIERIATIFKDSPLYVHIFTDDLNPQNIVEKYKTFFKNRNITFACRNKGNGPDVNIFEDFFSMIKFDCFIRSQSGYSTIASHLAQHSLAIAPLNYSLINNEVVINEIEIIFRNHGEVHSN